MDDSKKLLETEEPQQQTQSLLTRMKRLYRNTRRKNFIYAQIERISLMTLFNMINDPIANILFHKYLINEHPLGQIEIKPLLRCYRLCEEILWNTELIRDLDTTTELLHLCPPIIWEQQLAMLVEQSRKKEIHNKIRIMMKKLMEDCIIDMECTSSYHRFYTDTTFKIEKIKKYLGDIFDDREFFEINKIPIQIQW